MNWKFNYWTILFAVVAIGWAVTAVLPESDDAQATATGMNKVPILGPAAAPPVLLDTISRKEADRRIKNYISYIKDVERLIKQQADGAAAGEKDPFVKIVKDHRIQNPDIEFFKIPAGELQSMVNQYEGKDSVYAILTLEDLPQEVGNNVIDNSLIDLIFCNLPPKRQAHNGDGIYYAPKGGTFYDFTNPCPTLCDTSQQLSTMVVN